MTDDTGDTRRQAAHDASPQSPGPAPDSDSANRRRLTAWTTGVAGVTVTSLLALADAFWPALVVLAGVMTTSGLLLVRRGGDKQYVLAGVVYCLGVAFVFEALGPSEIPEVYMRAVLPAVGGLGAISGILVLIKVVGKRIVGAIARRVVSDEAYVRQLWDTLAAAGSLLTMVWLALTFTEKVTRYALASVGVVTALVLNLLGYQWYLSRFGVELELIMATFVFCLLVWFHLLDTLHESWQTARMSAQKAASQRGRVTGLRQRVSDSAEAHDTESETRN